MSKLLRDVAAAYCLCIVLTFVSSVIVLGDSFPFFPLLILQALAFTIAAIAAMLLNGLFSVGRPAASAIAYMISYLSLSIVLFEIKGATVERFLAEYYKLKNLLECSVPFIGASLLMIIWRYGRGDVTE